MAMPHFVIVGGGTAGWMSAVYLKKMLAGSAENPVRVTVVESDETSPIGVGEATIPSFVRMMKDCDIAEYLLFAEADATFKNAIKFVNWAGETAEAPGRQSFYHQFDQPPVYHGQSAIVHWLALKAAGAPVEPLDQATNIGSALCDAGLAPKLFHSPPYEAPVPYAYHLDAVKLGRLLRRVAEERGVVRIVGHVSSVDLGDDGSIVAIQTKEGQDIEGDFFVDCSGFRSLLIEQTLVEPFVSLGDKLICDRAVTCQVPHVDEQPRLRPFTTCTAQPAGWTWEIDIQSRTGVGYVYSSRFSTDEEARATLIDQIGASYNPDLPIREIPMRIGRRDRTWVKNCLAVGLSGGFLEPLESTGIHMIELALRLFVDHVGLGEQAEPLRRQYNKLMAATFDDIAEFLMLHYCLNGRTGYAFWDHCRSQISLPASLTENLQLWSLKAPSGTELGAKVRVFDGFSYSAVLSGLGVLPIEMGNLSPFVDLRKSADALDRLRDFRAKAVSASPPHSDIVRKLRASGG